MSTTTRNPLDAPFHVVSDGDAHRLGGPVFDACENLKVYHGADGRQRLMDSVSLMNLAYAIGMAAATGTSVAVVIGGAK